MNKKKAILATVLLVMVLGVVTGCGSSDSKEDHSGHTPEQMKQHESK